MTSNLYLDKRRLGKSHLATLKVVISKHGTVGMIPIIKISPAQWDNGEIINHPNAKLLNSMIKVRVGEIEKLLLELSNTGETSGKTATEICNIIRIRLNPDTKNKRTHEDDDFLSYFHSHINSIKNNGTKQLYTDTYHKIIKYCEEEGIKATTFSSINRIWLQSFEQYCLSSQSQNTASRHLRDIRAVINAAIDDGITTNYPFRRFRIKKEETIDKSFTASELRSLFNYKCYEGGQQEAVDMFKLMFFLIGINSIDLAQAPEISSGRLNYVRAKTHKPYSIKIEPEAQKIINKYKGSNGHLINILERVPNYKTYFNRLAKTLRKVGLQRVPGKKNIGEAILPDICTGSARTSWATIAQEELDIPRDVIAAALGHHTVDVTSTYLRTDWRKKVDAANRKVIDWVLYQKKSEE